MALSHNDMIQNVYIIMLLKTWCGQGCLHAQLYTWCFKNWDARETQKQHTGPVGWFECSFSSGSSTRNARVTWSDAASLLASALRNWDDLETRSFFVLLAICTYDNGTAWSKYHRMLQRCKWGIWGWDQNIGITTSRRYRDVVPPDRDEIFKTSWDIRIQMFDPRFQLQL